MTGLAAVTATGVPARLEVDLSAPPGELLTQQRTRLAARLDLLDPQGWHGRTRCPLWDVADVVTHLGDATQWALSALGAADTGAAVPEVLQGFDPNRTPHDCVLIGRGRPTQARLARLRESTGALARHLTAARRPGGPCVPWVGGHRYSPELVAMHVLWDSWLHELDLAAALAATGSVPQAPCPGELDAVAAYGLFLAGVVLSRGLPAGEQVSLRVELEEFEYDLHVGSAVRLSRAVGPRPPESLLLSGPAVAVTEAVSGRGDLGVAAGGTTRAVALLGALATRMREPALPSPSPRP
jgi:uncharacterized protein (TIGR03083 family)